MGFQVQTELHPLQITTIINNYFRILSDKLGKCARPKVGWQIDPFGHSREHGSILSQLGFDGVFLGRLDYRDKENRRKEKTLDFIWQTSANLGINVHYPASSTI